MLALQLKNTMEGKHFLIDWSSKLHFAIFLGFTRASGIAEVQVSDKPVIGSGNGMATWGFYPLNPWMDRFDKAVNRLVASGLTQFWRYEALASSLCAYTLF